MLLEESDETIREILELDKTIRENHEGKYLIVHANHLKEMIEYAREVQIPQIQLNGWIGKDTPNVIDFKLFEKLSDCLKILNIQYELDNIINLESIYSLKNLEKIYIQNKQNKQKFILDISRFPKLKHFGGEYWNGLLISKAYSLTSMVLIKLKDNDLKQLSELKQLSALHIYSSKIKSLDGIDNLPIKELCLAHNPLLENIESIKNLSGLEVLRIRKCKKLDAIGYNNEKVYTIACNNKKLNTIVYNYKKLDTAVYNNKKSDTTDNNKSKKLPSKLFPNCSFEAGEHAYFQDIIPEGFTNAVRIHLGTETTENEEAVIKAAEFFDKIREWDTLCRSMFLSAEEGSTVTEYFEFYKEELQDVLDEPEISDMSLNDMVKSLKLSNMFSNGSGLEQEFTVDFTAEFDQILCVRFDSESNFKSIDWES